MTNQRSTNNAEPVAWRWRDNEDEPWQLDYAWWSASRIADMRAKHRYVQPLYASPTGNSEHGGVSEEAVEALRGALEAARTWHEAEDKALSKQPPSHGPNGNQWARLQHQEQIAEITAALTAASVQQGSREPSVQETTMPANLVERLREAEAHRDHLAGLLWYAYHEFNAIRARSGAPLDQHGMTLCAPDYWDRLTEAFKSALRPDEVAPWPSDRARQALEQVGKP